MGEPLIQCDWYAFKKKRGTQRRWPCDYSDRDWNETPTSQETPRVSDKLRI